MELSRTRKNINIFLFVLFGLFAIAQFNDPDPLSWVSIYGIVALISIVYNYKEIPRLPIFIISLLIFIYAGYHFAFFIEYLQIENKNELFGEMVYEKPYLEGTREFLGLTMAGLALIFQLNRTS
jgi:hypothetical protein